MPEQRAETAFDIPADSRLIVRNTNGSITCRRGGGRGVRVVALREEMPELPRTRFIEISVEPGPEYVVKCRYSCSRVPAGASLELEIPAGLEGLLLETMNGSIVVEGPGCAVKASTCNGFIRCLAPAGPVELSTRNGRIDTMGPCIVSSISTVIGDVRIELGAVHPSGATITAVTGSIEVAMPADISLEVDAATGRGRLSALDLGIRSPEAGHGSIRGMLGAGGPKLIARTHLGDLALCRQRPPET